jgi:hypothetical protein
MYLGFAPVGGLGECTPLPTNVRNTLKQNPKSKLRAYRAIARIRASSQR